MFLKINTPDGWEVHQAKKIKYSDVAIYDNSNLVPPQILEALSNITGLLFCVDCVASVYVALGVEVPAA